jgi:hypothetical protein
MTTTDTNDIPNGGTPYEAVAEVIRPRFPEYERRLEEPIEPAGFRGNDQVIVGKSGYLYENGYINEFHGFAPKYVSASDAEMLARVRMLKYIQDKMKSAGKAFAVVITPSKGADYSEFIPDWYMRRFITPPNYVRPYIRFRQMLIDEGVYFIDSQDVFSRVGLTNTFPKNGIHWNKLAAYEVSDALIAEYERQMGVEVRRLAADGIITSDTPPGFGNPEQDILGLIRAGFGTAGQASIIYDDYFYWPDVYTDDMNKPAVPNIVVQGGSFVIDIIHYFNTFNIADTVSRIPYNNRRSPNTLDYGAIVRSTNYLIMEVNEQFVYGIGGDPPRWGQADFADAAEAVRNNFIDLLYNYMRTF